MRRTLTLVMILCLLFTAGGCSPARRDRPQNSEDDGRLKVVATIFPPYDFVWEIAGEQVSLTMLLSPGAESHSFEPTPQDIINIQNCDLFLYAGGENDQWVERLLDTIDSQTIELVPLMDLVEVVEEELVEGMEHGHPHDGEADHDDQEDDHDRREGPEYDEHVWTSPRNAITIVSQLTQILCRLDPDNKDTYQNNASAYLDSLRDLDNRYQDVVGGAKRKTIVFGDRFPFRYLADAYDLSYFAAFPGCSIETDASAATVAFLIDKVAEEEIPVVFYIELSNERMADVICEGTGAKKLLLHSCHNLTKDDFDSGLTYLQLMEQNLLHLKEALC